jgi:hypothetical protein
MAMRLTSRNFANLEIGSRDDVVGDYAKLGHPEQHCFHDSQFLKVGLLPAEWCLSSPGIAYAEMITADYFHLSKVVTKKYTTMSAEKTRPAIFILLTGICCFRLRLISLISK